MTSQMCDELVVLISDPFRLGVMAGAIVLVLSITVLRFCGSLSLPPKAGATPTENAPVEPTTTTAGVLSKAAASPTTYRSFLDTDAKRAGVAVPTIEQMSHKLTYRSDDA